ncbi:uncharacterized protein LOC118847096 [Trichosurus vulpecula]|uniref:uncharacterized protein LOC118847096 n=1 Tax=Trichosurus vulpecula TaxID=9337 RepID=UPI00186AE435|nr:uncharacterized protein LOC118847096 [Trichosurus vulpecula]
MPRTKKEKPKIKGASLSIVPILTKFLKTYEKHCVQSQTSVCPAIKKALKTSIENEQILRKLMLVSPAVSPTGFPEVSLEPLLKTIRDERYMLGRELCIWGVKLKNSDVASLAMLLELRGRTMYPFSTLEIINSRMDLWSVERLSKSLLSSNLLSIVLDYNKFGNEGVDILMAGLEKNRKLKILSLRYCNLGPAIGSKLGWAISQSAICELYLSGNYLQCSGALGLIRHIAEFAETQGKDRATKVLQDRRRSSKQLLQENFNALHENSECLQLGIPIIPATLEPENDGSRQLRSSELQWAKPMGVHTKSAFNMADDIREENFQKLDLYEDARDTAATAAFSCVSNHIAHLIDLIANKEFCIKKNKKGSSETGPWLIKLHLADNGIDGRGKEGERGVLEFTQLLTYLIKYSDHLREIDLGNNVLGEIAATHILEALKERKKGKLPNLQIIVTPQISSDTFRSIWENSKKSGSAHKKKKKAKK